MEAAIRRSVHQGKAGVRQAFAERQRIRRLLRELGKPIKPTFISVVAGAA
jgi:hypothetical protein